MKTDLERLVLAEDPHAVVGASAAGQVLSWNNGAAAICGCSAENQSLDVAGPFNALRPPAQHPGQLMRCAHKDVGESQGPLPTPLAPQQLIAEVRDGGNEGGANGDDPGR